MNHSPTFNELLRFLAKDNLLHIKRRAFDANGVSKVATGSSRQTAYAVKNRAISQLLERGRARVVSISLEPDTLLDVRFTDGGMLHAAPQEMRAKAQELILRQLLDRLGWPGLVSGTESVADLQGDPCEAFILGGR